MLDPFDADSSLRNELRDAWREIERLKEENSQLKESNLELTKEIMRLGAIILEQSEEIEALEGIRDEELDAKQREWNLEGDGSE